MGPKEEFCILQGVLKAIESSRHPPSKARYWLTTIALWLVITVLFIVVFQNAGELRWPHYLLGASSFLLGLGAAYVFYRSMFYTQWPVVVAYVDRDKIERRLTQLRP